MRTCQYPGCDRRLVTGRKYCYLHRSYGKESISGNSLINSAKTEYLKKKNIKRNEQIGTMLFMWLFLTIVIGIFLAYIIFTFNLSGNVLSPILFFGLVFIFPILFSFYMTKKYGGVIEIPHDPHKNRDPEYIEFVQEKVKKAEEEKDFRKKLLNREFQIPITICWNCKTQYPFTKNHSGETQVTCPNCGSKGVVK